MASLSVRLVPDERLRRARERQEQCWPQWWQSAFRRVRFSPDRASAVESAAVLFAERWCAEGEGTYRNPPVGLLASVCSAYQLTPAEQRALAAWAVEIAPER